MTVGIGDAAPGFTLRDQHGRRRSLTELRGRPVLLVFFPFAFSAVCTGELRELRDHTSRIERVGAAELLAVSCDPMFALRVFAEQDGLELPLLSDFWPHGEVSRMYGAFDDEHGCPTRSTFLIDGDGVVRWSVRNPMGEARALDDYVGALDQLYSRQGV
jgi:peroxiredoxin